MARFKPLTADQLRAALRDVALDGREAQRAMEPRRRGPRPARATTSEPRDAAALAYVFEREGALRLPLTLRSESLPEHRGQVSLPGGRPQDRESLEATARREAREEIGLETPKGHEVLGWLAPVYIPVTHSRLHVLVCYGDDPGTLTPDPREVSALSVVSLDELVDPDRRRTRMREIQGEAIEVPYFDVDGLFLWGATAMALAELVARLRRAAA